METFDITGDDLKDLRDDDLRGLIGLLCEADYRNHKLGTSGIVFGGNQDAADGGFDVVVHGNFPPPSNSFVPRAYTGFQVKKPAMSPSTILKEMKPNGELRDSIKDLIKEGGAYIIVSSTASTSSSALQARKEAMRNAISDHVGHENLHVDFFDRSRIATWVRCHPPLTLWVKTKLGRSLQGWQPYTNWSAPGHGLLGNYLLDDAITVYLGTKRGNNAKNALEAIGYLRQKLSHPKSILRIVGLSGVGKTRFVQALFDERIGGDHLDSSLVIYTDLSDHPSPDPTTFARNLTSQAVPAIMIVDNCSPDLHRRLVPIFDSPECRIRLLTIEYDVREDLPEETDVIRLEPASLELIRQFIKQRHPKISQVNISTIAEFSGGNFRVALALAGTIKQGETLGRLQDVELFKRLFYQTNSPNENLLHGAEAIALVYSFEGEDVDSAESELSCLAALVDRSSLDLFKIVAELQNRDLIQARGVWRAILPHAIANRLAEQALKTIPITRILNAFLKKGRERLLRSFSRRLCFLHDSVEAKQIARQWLSVSGWIGKTGGNLNTLEREVLQNIAPIVPEEVLSFLERWTENMHVSELPFLKENRFQDFTSIIRQSSYAPLLFPRGAALICKLILTNNKNGKFDSTKDDLRSLFYIYLSGTHASAEQRAKVIDDLWNLANEQAENLALYLLDAAYETFHFTPAHRFNFGAHQRDYGWQPNKRVDFTNWYKTFIMLGVSFALSNSNSAREAKRLLAKRFRGMWTKRKMHTELEQMVDRLLAIGPWHEGWAQVCATIRHDTEENTPDGIKRLWALESKMRPNSLLETVRAYAMSDHLAGYVLDNTDNQSSAKNTKNLEDFVEELGRKVANDSEVFTIILPDILTIHNNRIWHLGRGLAEGASDKLHLWQLVRSTISDVPKEKIKIQCLGGILSAAAMDIHREEIMETIVDDELLSEHFPQIQMVSTITPSALKRLYRSLELGRAPISDFQNIGWGKAHEALNDEALVPFLRKLQEKEGGITVALDIINMRFLNTDREHSDAVYSLAKDILSLYPYDNWSLQQHDNGYSLAQLAEKSLKGTSGENTATAICTALQKLVTTSYHNDTPFYHLLEELVKLHPLAFLNVFFSEGAIDAIRKKAFFRDYDPHRTFFRQISAEEILQWCRQSPANRCWAAISALAPFQNNSESESIDWNPLVLHIIDLAPDVKKALEWIEPHIVPNSWSGARSEIILRNAEVIKKLFSHKNNEVCSWAKDQYDRALRTADKDRKLESQLNIEISETFE